MFMLGEYHIDEAREVAEYLSEAGMKVDIRTFTSSRSKTFDYLEGRFSELRGELKAESIERYERILAILRKLLNEGVSAQDFRDRFQLEMDPHVNDKKNQMDDLFGEDLGQEDRESRRDRRAQIMKDLADISLATSFIETVMDRNEVEIGTSIGDRLDDPILRVFPEKEEVTEEHPLARTTTFFTVEPRAEVLIEELSSVFIDEIDDSFKEEYAHEYMDLLFLSKLVSEISSPSSSGKIDMESFAEVCDFQMENNGHILVISGSRAAEELARALEKKGLIKVKGDKIKWRR